MGFRFRRSVKLLPGLRLNFGLHSASLGIGTPGAMLNFSGRGARTTFGIPGTGFSWSPSSRSGQLPERYRQPLRRGQSVPINTVAELEAAIRDPNAQVVYRGSGRRLSPTQLEAMHRKLLHQELRQQAQAEIDRYEADLRERLACWREMPSIPSPHDYQAALAPQVFVYPSAPPSCPNLGREREMLGAQLRLKIDADTPAVPLTGAASFGLGGSVLGVIVGAGGTLLSERFASASPPTWLLPLAACIVIAGAVVGLIVHTLDNARRKAAVDSESLRQRELAWPTREQHLLQAYANAVAAYERGRAEAEASWRHADGARIAWATRLLQGDTAAVHEAVSDSLGDLDFPFETEATFAIENAKVGYLHVDLPEIEDVMPATRFRVLSDGRTKEVKRDEGERNAEYGELACGIGLMMASAAFAAAPTMACIEIAAYTQREQKGKHKGRIDDEYVYVASLSREALARIDANRVAAMALVSRTAKLEQQSNQRLKKLAAKELPAWVGELRGEPPRTSTPAIEPLRVSTTPLA